MTVQAPPNLHAEQDLPALLAAGLDDWGGVSPVTLDHVNPEAPWPELERLAQATAAAGHELVPRLAVHPAYVAEVDRWCAPAVAAAVRDRADADGLAREDGWAAGRDETPPRTWLRRVPGEIGAPVAAALDAARRGEELDEDAAVALLGARGTGLRAVLDAADAVRREVNGDVVSYVVTRNVNYTNVCYFRCGFCAFSKGRLAEDLRGAPYLVPLDEIARRAREAWDRGATEICLQGGIHPAFTGDFYLDVVRAVKSEVPDLHVHAFSALEVWQGAATLGVGIEDYLARLRDAGLASLPGTAAEILDDEVRAVLCPDKVSTDQWLAVHDAAHRVGLRSTTTIMYGAVEAPRSWARHLLALREQQRRTGGFTEFVPLPFVHMEAPIYRRGRARPGPTFREAILLHAVARLVLHPWITNVQASWVKLGLPGAAEALRAGCNDLGGTLMNESISRAAGAAHGQELTPERMDEAIRAAGRVPRQRTTFYDDAPAERQAASYGAPPCTEPLNPPVQDAGLVRPARLLRPRGLPVAQVDGGAPGVASGQARRPGGVRPRGAAARLRGLRVDGGGVGRTSPSLAGSRTGPAGVEATRGRRGLRPACAGRRPDRPAGRLHRPDRRAAGDAAARQARSCSLEAAGRRVRGVVRRIARPGSTPPARRCCPRRGPRPPPSSATARLLAATRRPGADEAVAGLALRAGVAGLVVRPAGADERDDAEHDGEDAGGELPLRHRRPEDADRTQRDHAGGEDEHEQQQVALRPPQAEAERQAEDHRRDRDEGRDVRRQGVAGVIVVGVVVPVRMGIGHRPGC